PPRRWLSCLSVVLSAALRGHSTTLRSGKSTQSENSATYSVHRRRHVAWPRMAEPLIDSYGRRVKDLRISITDRCNFRCVYCMPEDGLEWLDRSDLLTYEEQARIARVCVERFGFESIRVTGGEPTVRDQLPRLFELLAPLGVDLAMTTNGVRLPDL